MIDAAGTQNGQSADGADRLAPAANRTIFARETAKRAANRHSRLVRSAKFALPVIVVIVALVFAGRMMLNAVVPGLNMPAVLFSKNGLTMVEPRLTGRSRDRAYDIGATRATQDFTSPKIIQLEQLSGRVEMDNKGWAKIDAKTGTYDGNRDGLKLMGAVVVTTSNGYMLNADDADIDLAKGNMTTDNKVHIEGPLGVIDAGGARVTESGKMIKFITGVRMTINPGAMPPSPASTAAETAQ